MQKSFLFENLTEYGLFGLFQRPDISFCYDIIDIFFDVDEMIESVGEIIVSVSDEKPEHCDFSIFGSIRRNEFYDPQISFNIDVDGLIDAVPHVRFVSNALFDFAKQEELTNKSLWFSFTFV